MNAAVGGSSQLSYFLQEAQTHSFALLKSKYLFLKLFFSQSSPFYASGGDLIFQRAQHSSLAAFCALTNLRFLLLKGPPLTHAEASAWEKSHNKIKILSWKM